MNRRWRMSGRGLGLNLGLGLGLAAPLLFAGLGILLLAPACFGQIASGPENAVRGASLPITLQKCLAAAFETNPALLAEQDAVAASRQRRDRAKSALLPRVKAEDTHTRLRHINSIDVPGAGSMPMGKQQLEVKALRMSQPIYTGGALENGVRAAQAEVRLRGHLETRQREDLARSIAEAWYGLLSARAMEQVASQALTDTLGHERNVAALLEAGVTIRDELLKVQVAILERRENLVRARNGIDLACSRLNMLSGLSLTPETPIADQTASGLPVLDEAAARALASQAHPLLQAAREKIRIGEASAKAAKGSLQPNVAVQWNWQSGTAFTPSTDNWDATLYIGLNVFDAGEARSRIREARAERDKARHERDDLVRGLDLAIRQARLQLNEAQARLELASQAEVQASESMRLTEERYKAGAATSQSLLDAESALIAARQRRVTAGFDRELANVALWHAAGRLEASLLNDKTPPPPLLQPAAPASLMSESR